MITPRVSILIPTLDGAPDLDRLLPALRRQQVEGGVELRAIDSSSDDGTVAQLRAYGAHVDVIPRSEFRHGTTRNALAEGARGEFFLFLSQDTVPCGDDFIATLVAAFERDPLLAGATARVLPHEDDDPLTARTVLGAPEAGDHTLVLGGPAAAASEGPRFNNVAGMVRASHFREVPFPDVAFGEDFAWATRVLARGWRVAFVAEAVVRHAHRYGPSQAFERYRTDARFHREERGHIVRPSVRSVARGLLFELREDVRYVRANGAPLRHLLRAPGLRAAQVLGQFVGSRGPVSDPQRAAHEGGPLPQPEQASKPEPQPGPKPEPGEAQR
ncbi:MAG: glycosyltransferase [Planctomycetota bacterium]